MLDHVSHHSLECLSRLSSGVNCLLLVVETRVVDTRSTSNTSARVSVRNAGVEENNDLQNIDIPWNIGESSVSSMSLISSTGDHHSVRVKRIRGAAYSSSTFRKSRGGEKFRSIYAYSA